MVLLGVLFIVQFSVSIAALAIGNTQQDSIASKGWCALADSDKNDLQRDANCFGFTDVNPGSFNVTTVPNYCMRPGTLCPLSLPSLILI